MQNEFMDDPAAAGEDAAKKEAQSHKATSERRSAFARWANHLTEMGLGESLLKIGTHLFSAAALAVVVILTQAYYSQARHSSAGAADNSAPASEALPPPASNGALDAPVIEGISRAAQIHTNIPTRPRYELITYTVLEGDTVFGIADKFGLQPQTILWGNYTVLLDDPHSLKPGQQLNILPVDGVYWEWLGGIPFGDWAAFYGVTAADIIEFPGNNIDPDTVGDYYNANIRPGTWLIIPGGKREFVSWSAPLGVTRENPASARVLGAGACPPVSGGAVGYGNFIYPTNKRYLSGFDYSPSANHYGLDFAGNMGEAVYASDAGVIVYAGWNDYGYGNMIMVDHGNGFQTLYAHLSAIHVGCGQSVGQGEVIGAIGSTGRSSGAHLHFELMAGTKLNPWNYLPPP